MLDKETYTKEFIRMMDSIRETHKGEENCNGVMCDNGCPLKDVCDYDCYTSKPPVFEIIEIVEKWAKGHPVITMKKKYEEVFGVVPNIAGVHGCPYSAGFYDYNINCDGSCDICKEQFWNSEYKEPVKSKKSGEVN